MILCRNDSHINIKEMILSLSIFLQIKRTSVLKVSKKLSPVFLRSLLNSETWHNILLSNKQKTSIIHLRITITPIYKLQFNLDKWNKLSLKMWTSLLTVHLLNTKDLLYLHCHRSQQQEKWINDATLWHTTLRRNVEAARVLNTSQ